MKISIRSSWKWKKKNTSHLWGKCGVYPITIKCDVSNGQMYLWHLSEPLFITATCLKGLAWLCRVNSKCPMRSHRDKFLLKLAVNLQRRTQMWYVDCAQTLLLSAMIQLMFTWTKPPETLDAKCCCSAHSTSDRKMRLLHSLLVVTGEVVVACSYTLKKIKGS